jgi:hypothetical protein
MLVRVVSKEVLTFLACCGLLLGAPLASAQDPWADQVVSYDAGSGGMPGYDDPATTLGSPERFTGEGTPYEAVVSMFNPPWGTDELLSIGEGGYLVVEFDQPVTNDPQHLYGVDLIIFGNGGFIDTAYPNGQIGSPAAMFGDDPMQVSVSTDGVDFVSLGDFTEGRFPTQGYLDAGPYDTTPGSAATSFIRPIDPGLTLSDFDGLSFTEALSLYDGSGGGTPIDIGPAGLETIRFVRIDMLEPGGTVEIDAFSTVPEPASATLLGLLASTCAFRKRS